MNRLLSLIMSVFSITYLLAQTPYEKAVRSGIELLNDDRQAGIALFERIALAENDKWLPHYYAAYGHINSSWGQYDSETTLRHIQKAQEHINDAKSLNGDKAEIGVLQGLLNTTYITLDGRTYGPKLSGPTSKLYDDLIREFPDHPRVVLSRAEWLMGSARYFNKPITPYCEEIKRAKELLESESKDGMLPSWGVARANSAINACKKLARQLPR